MTPSPPPPLRITGRIAATVALAASLVLNALANTLPLNDRTTGELSAVYPNLFVPAGLTFSIWSVIYLALAAWAIAQFVPSPRHPSPNWGRLDLPRPPSDRRALGESIAWPFALASLLNALWLVAWHWEQVALSVVFMTTLLAVLVVVNHRLAGSHVLLPRIAFGLYLGWIVVATVANVTALLVALGWSGRVPGLGWLIPGQVDPDAFWAGAMAAVGALVLRGTIRRLAATWAGAAGAWGLAGIVLARSGDHPGVALVAALGALLVLATTIRTARTNRANRADQASQASRADATSQAGPADQADQADQVQDRG